MQHPQSVQYQKELSGARMEVYQCEDAVHAALKQRRPKLIVDIINKVLGLQHRTARACVHVCVCVHGMQMCNWWSFRVSLQHLAEEAPEKNPVGVKTAKKSIEFVCIECKTDGMDCALLCFGRCGIQAIHA